MNDLVTRLLLDSKEFDGNLTKSTKEVQDFQKNIEKGMQSAKASFDGLFSIVGKFAPAIGASVGAFEAFKKTIQSTESGLDAWERSMQVAESATDSFFIAIANGNFNPLLSGLEKIIDAAREAYDAMDALGTLQNFQSVKLAEINRDREQLKYEIAKGKKDGTDTTGLQAQLLALNKNEVNLMEEETTTATKAILAKIKEIVVKETGGWYDEGLATKWIDWDNFQKLTKEGLAEEGRLIEEEKKELGSQYDLVVANYKKYKELVESGNASEKVQDAIKIVDAEREYQIKKAIVDQESKLVEVQNKQVNLLTKQANLYSKQRADLKQIDSSQKNISKETVKQVKYNTGNLKTIIGNIQFNGQSLLTPELSAIIDALPADTAQEFEKDFSKILTNQKENKFQLNSGLTNDKDFNTKELAIQAQINSVLKNILYKIDSEPVTGFDPTNTKSIIQAISYSQANNMLDNAMKMFPQFENATIKDEEILSNAVKDFNILFENLEKLKKGTGLVFDETLSQKFDLIKNEYNRMFQRWGSIVDDMQKMSNLNNAVTVTNSLTTAVSNLSQGFKDANLNATVFFANALNQTMQLIAQIANLCIINGVESASKLAYPYNLVAIASSVATISSIVGSAMQTFADGGIVQGNSTVGDKTLIRVNAGEMVLNRGQQQHLFNMLNSGDFGGNNGNIVVSGKLKAEGKDLIAVISNVNNKYSKLR